MLSSVSCSGGEAEDSGCTAAGFVFLFGFFFFFLLLGDFDVVMRSLEVCSAGVDVVASSESVEAAPACRDGLTGTGCSASGAGCAERDAGSRFPRRSRTYPFSRWLAGIGRTVSCSISQLRKSGLATKDLSQSVFTKPASNLPARIRVKKQHAGNRPSLTDGRWA